MSDEYAESGSLEWAYILETIFGETPAAVDMTAIRDVNFDLTLSKATFTSRERRSDRQTADMRTGRNSLDGTLDVEATLEAHDNFLQMVMGGTWATGATSGLLASVNIATTRVSVNTADLAGGWISAGFKVGDIITFPTSNVTGIEDKRFQLVSVATTVFRTLTTMVAAGASVGVASTTVSVVGAKLLIGNTKRSMSVQKKFTDITLHNLYRGIRLTSLTVNASPDDGIVGYSFGVMGREEVGLATAAYASTVAAAPVSTPLDVFSGELLEGNEVIGDVTALRITIDNRANTIGVFGSKFTPGVFNGRQGEFTAEITVLFKNPIHYNKFINETESSLDVRFQSTESLDTADFHRIRIPRLKYSGATMDHTADVGIPMTMPIVCLKPSAANDDASSIVFQRSNAA